MKRLFLIAAFLFALRGIIWGQYELIVEDQPGRMVQMEGLVRFQPAFGPAQFLRRPPQVLRLEESLTTSNLSRAIVFMSDKSELKMRSLTRLELQRRHGSTNALKLVLAEGEIYYANRGESLVSIPFETRDVVGTLRGTEFLLSVETNNTRVIMLDGEAELSNDRTPQPVRVRSRQVTEAKKGARIEEPQRIQATNMVQWWLYYPGVLDLDEISLTADDTKLLTASTNAYGQGNPSAALREYPGYPSPAEPQSDTGRIYLAGVLLSVGAVEQANKELNKLNSNAPLANALRSMIAAVSIDLSRLVGTNAPAVIRAPGSPTTASEWLALSYVSQATNNLAFALQAAGEAVARRPTFGFGWARVAELEFSIGHIPAARRAVDKALAFTPMNAQAHALRGFLLAAENRLHEAITNFDNAIAIDPSLGNAWLGRGLCKRRLGFLGEGRSGFGLFDTWTEFSEGTRRLSKNFSSQTNWLSDLQTAAALEPTRSLTRSYAGKAFAEMGDSRLARKELDYAKALDPNDPTPWLYSALLSRETNGINNAINDLEKSLELNDDRAVYRSRFLLDQDRAVRSANLANLYSDAGMTDVSVREAAKSVSDDYANSSAHLFLSDSYDALRDPTRFNLRYETVWFNELLLANILAPVGAGRLAQTISAQEYSKLFEANGLGIASSAIARTDGVFRERASQFGTIDNTSYALDLDYQHHNGIRPNNELDSTEWYSTVKQQITPQDSALILVKREDYHSGDNFQYYNSRQARRNFSFDESQDPIMAGAWHHEWSPGMHTMFLGARLVNEQRFSDRAAPQIILTEDASGKINGVDSGGFDLDYRNQLEIYSAELNQICDWNWLTASGGARFQAGQFEAASLMNHPNRVDFLLPTNSVARLVEGFDRVTGYSYLTLKPVEQLRLLGGVAYDQETIPRNFRHPPLTSGEDYRAQIGPKAAIVWTPRPEATLRGIYSRSLGGVSLDESYRLEPTQLAGFPQAFRTLISESLPGVGSVAAPKFETFGLALDLKFPSRTYVGILVERATSDVRRDIGVFVERNGEPPSVPSSLPERLEYEERRLTVTVNQLLAEGVALGARYTLSCSRLNDAYSANVLSAIPPTHQKATLHNVTSYILFNHASGFFARAELQWYDQQNGGYRGTQPGDAFLQENIFAGYRFFRNRAELRFGLLNLSGEDYRLNPLTVYEELPRERVFEAQLSLRF